MIPRILALSLLGVATGAFANYPNPAHIELSSPTNTARDAIALRLAVQSDSTGGGLEIDRIDRADGVIRIHTTVGDGPMPAGSEVFRTVLLDELDQDRYVIELHARLRYPADAEYTLLDRENVAFVPAITLIPADPSRFDNTSIVTAPAQACGPVLNQHVDTQVHLPEPPWSDAPRSFTHTVTLIYAAWPCPAGGDTDANPVHVPLRNAQTPAALPAGAHVVRIVHTDTDADTWMTDSRVVSFEVSDQLPARIAGSWFNADHLAQGLQIQVLPGGQVLASWYTFDASGTPATIIAQGASTGDTATLDGVILAGGRFPTAATSAGAPQPWGNLELEFIDCDHATLSWTTTRAGFSNGSLHLTRLSSQQGAKCGVDSDASGGQWQIVDDGPSPAGVN